MKTLASALLLLIAIPASAQRAISGPERTLFEYANHERATHGLAPFQWDDNLAAAALRHAEKMAAEQTLSHQLAGEPDLSARVVAAGVRYSKAAENIAEGPNTLEIHTGWMNSPPHRANLLDPELTSIGVGIVAAHGRLYAVQDFAHVIPELTIEQQERKVAQLLQQKGLHILNQPNQARKICAGGSGTGGALAFFQFTSTDLSSLPVVLEKEIQKNAYESAAVGACSAGASPATGLYHLAVLLY